MCRFTAYVGPSIALERIVVLPKHSLLEQSQNATEAKLSVNGDGFGIAWYTDQTSPGLYRDVLPAWSDGNLTSLCRMVTSRLFLAHVRASTQGETSRENCHPFTHNNWSFMHNGQIGDFNRVRRSLEATLPDQLYAAKRGNTDSELLFLLLLANGLEQDPFNAVNETIRQLTDVQQQLTTPNRISCAMSDGKSVFAFRYSSDQRSPSLYIGSDLDSGGCVLASEPLETKHDRWKAVPDQSFVVLNEVSSKITPLGPETNPQRVQQHSSIATLRSGQGYASDTLDHCPQSV